jgi:hypothetical protein
LPSTDDGIFALGAMVYDLGLRTPGLEADLTWWLGLT